MSVTSFGLLRKKISRFVRLSSDRRILLVEAATLLLAARVALAVCPFRFLRRGLGTFEPPSAGTAGAAKENIALALQVRWAIALTTRHLPFEAVCLPQAIAAQLLLRRRRVASLMHLGVALANERKLQAHAWLEAAGIGITGYPVASDLSELGHFRCE